MKPKLRLWLCWGLVSVCCAGTGGEMRASGASEAAFSYSSRLWQMEDGLPHNIVQAITQTRDGYLWVGTREGLARFDGVRFRTVELAPESKHPSVLCLMEGRDGTLWVGTESAGLFRVREGTVSRCPAPDGARDYGVFELHRSRDAVWVATSSGLLRWTGGALERQGDFRSLVESLCVDRDGGIWKAGNGLRRLDPPANTNYTPRAGVLPGDTRKLYCDPAGAFWMASGNGITRLHNGIATNYWKAGGPAGFVDAFLTDRQGQFWVGTYAGLSRFADGKFIIEGASDEPSYRVFTLFEDAEGTLWVGSEEGLARLTPKCFRTYTRQDGLTLNSVVSVCASQDGSTWVGVWGGGLNHFKDDRIQPFGKANGLSTDFVMALCEGRDGSLWVGADYGNALSQIQIQSGQVSLYGREQGFVPGTHTALLEDKESTLWIGTREGLQSFQNRVCKRYTTRDGLSHDKINALCLGNDGSLWIGTGGGLTRRSEGRFVDLSAGNSRLKTIVLSLYEDAQGMLWIGTEGDGLLRLGQGRVAGFSLDEGLLSDSIYSVLEDDQGNLWLNSSRGVFRVNKQELEAVAAGEGGAVTSIAYGKSDGILASSQYREVTQPAACKSRDGRLWFRTTQGVAVVDPEQITTNRRPPPVALEEIIADRRRVAGPERLQSGETVIVQKGRGELEIHYTALSLCVPERNRFRYRLEGVDPDWVEAGDRRYAYYNKVAPGAYRFQVIACNNDGVWNDAGATARLELEPHFWQTSWFLAFCAIASLGLVAGLVTWMTRARMRRELVRLEQQHAIERERARIARDMHDELGAKLARISFQGARARRALDNPAQAGPQIEDMAQTARELVSSLDEIVWAVDPENDSLENLANYTCRHASEFFENGPVACEFVIPTALPPYVLGSDVRHNLFLATKEALTNVLKHSQAARVQIQFAVRDGEFELVIADDGIGLGESHPPGAEPAAAKPKRAGHGLANIRERLAAIGGRAEITGPGKGTCIRFIVPLGTGAGMSSIHPTHLRPVAVP